MYLHDHSKASYLFGVSLHNHTRSHFAFLGSIPTIAGMDIVELLHLIHNLIHLGTTRDRDSPTGGEQVVVFSPGGDPAAGFVVTGLFSDAPRTVG